MVNIVNVSYLISFAEGKERDVDKERRNFRFLRGRNSSLERGSACFLMKGSPAGAQSFATVPLWLQEPLLYRLAGAIIGACKKKKEKREKWEEKIKEKKESQEWERGEYYARITSFLVAAFTWTYARGQYARPMASSQLLSLSFLQTSR